MTKAFIKETPAEFKKYEEKLLGLTYGDSIRVVHKFNSDGTNCSIGKDEAMSWTRYYTGWSWICWRCGDYGFVSNKISPPSVTKSMVKDREPPEPDTTTDTISLPYDAVPMFKEGKAAKYKVVPTEAWQWFWTAGISDALIEKYNVCWSDVYDRVIIPIKQYIVSDKGYLGERLVGWSGRCVRTLTKEERKDISRPKYLTKKIKGAERIYFYTPIRTNEEWIIIVEDCLSAIKISSLTKIPCLALLNKSIGDHLIGLCRGKRVIIWLDHDAKSDAFKAMSKMNTLSIPTKMISTYADPKLLPDKHIIKLVERRTRTNEHDSTE